jgi:hypothetical protein
MSAVRLAASGVVIGLATPFVSGFARQYVGASPIANAGITFGTAWLLSMGAKFVPFTRKYENDILLAGATIAAAQLIATYITPRLGLGGSANPMMGSPRRFRRMGDLVTLPAGNYDPYYGTTPKIAGSTAPPTPAQGQPSQAATIKGLITMPRRAWGANYQANYGR